jgi:site-specific recombinase XerD
LNIQLLVEIATIGIRFFFEVTLDDRQVMRMMSTVHEPRKLPVILSPEEVKRLLDATTAKNGGDAGRFFTYLTALLSDIRRLAL